ncbi:MAG: hypothetical protein DHS20C15_01540 [Planctomycetota bacterium]|nr:MAG: hypothetical protein DHS20C15_01540 [Planctomycetota bacterium]
MPRILLIFVSLALVLSGCSGGDDDKAPDSTAQQAGINSTFHLLSFSRLQGFAEGVPCNPDEIQPLPAALEYAEQLRTEGDRVILACVGDAVFWSPSMTQHKASQLGARGRSEPLLHALKAAGVEVYVPGHGDFAMGYASLLSRARDAGLEPLISNLEVEGFEDILRDRLVVEHDGLRIGFLGLIPPARTGSDIEVHDAELGTLRPPIAVAEEKVRVLREEDQVDIVLIYSNLSQQTNGELAQIEGVRFVLGTADPGVAADRMTLIDGVGLMTMRTQGRELALTTLNVRDGNLTFANQSPLDPMRRDIAKNQRSLDESIEEYGTSDPEELAQYISPHNPQVFLDFMGRFEEDIAWLAQAEQFDGTYIEHHRAELSPTSEDNPVLPYLAQQGPATNAALELVTRVPLEEMIWQSKIPKTETCVSCHADQVSFWQGTDHAAAVDNLRTIERSRDGSCLICHATGYREDGGFNDVRLEDPLGAVTCWNCHQANQVHVISPRGHTNPRHFDGERKTIGERCSRCHTNRRDPDFELEHDLDAIACPPMRVDDPALVQARQATLTRIAELREAGTGNEFDHYLEARALLGLGQRDQAIDGFVRYATVAQSTEVLPIIDAASLLDRAGYSSGAIRVLEAALVSRAGEPQLNMQVVRLLLDATDPSVRNAERAVATMEQFLPPEVEIDYRTVDMRKMQVRAYFAAGYVEKGSDLLITLRNKYPADDDVAEMMRTHNVR